MPNRQKRISTPSTYPIVYDANVYPITLTHRLRFPSHLLPAVIPTQPRLDATQPTTTDSVTHPTNPATNPLSIQLTNQLTNHPTNL